MSGGESWTVRLSTKELMLLNCGTVGKDSWVPWMSRRSRQSFLKEINSEYSLEGLMLKRQHFGHLTRRADSLERPWCWERLRAGGEGGDRQWDGWMASPTPGDRRGQRILAFCNLWVTRSQHDLETENSNVKRPRCVVLAGMGRMWLVTQIVLLSMFEWFLQFIKSWNNCYFLHMKTICNSRLSFHK